MPPRPDHRHRDHDDDDRTDQVLIALLRALSTLIHQGARIMSAVTDIRTFLDQLNTYTNTLAASQAEQTAAITEIGTDVDTLLANQELDAETKARLQTISDGLAAAVAASTAQAATLKSIAARNDNPLPAPVPVPPING